MTAQWLDEAVNPAIDARAAAGAAWHALSWLVIANAAGVLLAILLLVPSLNLQFGGWPYGRWMMVHMNLELYGWTAIPMLGFLFRVYRADRGALALWCRPLLWIWSAALLAGSFSWLSGETSGKLFLDWCGYARVFFCAALFALWLFLVTAFLRNRCQVFSFAARTGKAAGLLILLAVPFAIYAATAPGGYPPVNPSSGGPTGASQLESSLAIVLILLMLPYGLAPRRPGRGRILTASWLLLIAESVLCAALGRSDVSHHRPAQYLSLASLLLWLPVVPAYYNAFAWNGATRRWRLALLWWWSALVVTGWIFFLPGVLDHFKFTDGLVGHSFVAMAGFTSSLIIFVMVQLLGEGGWIFNRSRSFYLWQGSVIAYILIMTAAGWREGFDPAFTIVPGPYRDTLYALRLISGVLMLVASLDWLIDCKTLLRSSAHHDLRTGMLLEAR